MPPKSSAPAGVVSQNLGFGDNPSQELQDELARRKKKLSQASQVGDNGIVSQYLFAQPPGGSGGY